MSNQGVSRDAASRLAMLNRPEYADYQGHIRLADGLDRQIAGVYGRL
jgi:hypothetical protein